MPRFRPEALSRILQRILVAAGATPAEASTVASLGIDAHLSGHDSHGTLSLLGYVKKISNGEIVAGAKVEVIRETDSTLVLDGNWGFGQVVVREATLRGIRKARKAGTCVVSVRRANHLGRLSDYLRMVTGEGMAAIMMANAHGQRGLAAPFGGIDPRLSTNPIGFGVPTGGTPLILDMTTTVAAGGKVALAHNLGEPVPDGWLIDSRGHPTNDPGVILEDPPGSLLPLGGPAGYKGFGLGLAVESLAGALSGAGCTDWDRIQGGNAVFLNVINVASFAHKETFEEQMRGFLERIKAPPMAPGFDEIRIPGEREARERRRRRREGISLPERTWREVVATARSVGLSLDNSEDGSP